MKTASAVEDSPTRFEFGANWLQFLDLIDDERIATAEASLREMLQLGPGGSLEGRKFLDIGSGSGLFSLAARRLGALVCSFDYDPKSVACTRALRGRFSDDDDRWQVVRGSVLDRGFVGSLGTFDVVYAWGVLHHTGNMQQAIANAASLVAPRGQLFIAVYNDQGAVSRYWRAVKRMYNASPTTVRHGIAAAYFAYFAASLFIADVVRGRNPLLRHSPRSRRGMNMYRDVVDWVGGLPFEVASRSSILHLCQLAGFEAEKVNSWGRRHGCNEFVFRQVV